VDAILDATESVLAAEGLAGVTTKRVAQAAGISIGAFYQYFPTREGVLAAVEERAWRQHAEALARRVMELAGQPLAVAMPAVVKTMVTLIAAKAAVHSMTHDNELPDAMRAARRELLGRTVTLLAGALAASYPGQVRRTRVELALTMSIHTVTTLTFIGMRDFPESVKTGEYADEVAAMITRYLVD
jgi:AcrR family transcriptional regulator